MEHLKNYDENNGTFECNCGPDPMEDSFVPCLSDGTVISNPPGEDGRYYTLCIYCGRIIDEQTFMVIGQREVDDIDNELDLL